MQWTPLRYGFGLFFRTLVSMSVQCASNDKRSPSHCTVWLSSLIYVAAMLFLRERAFVFQIEFACNISILKCHTDMLQLFASFFALPHSAHSLCVFCFLFPSYSFSILLMHIVMQNIKCTIDEKHNGRNWIVCL